MPRSGRRLSPIAGSSINSGSSGSLGDVSTLSTVSAPRRKRSRLSKTQLALARVAAPVPFVLPPMPAVPANSPPMRLHSAAFEQVNVDLYATGLPSRGRTCRALARRSTVAAADVIERQAFLMGMRHEQARALPMPPPPMHRGVASTWRVPSEVHAAGSSSPVPDAAFEGDYEVPLSLLSIKDRTRVLKGVSPQLVFSDKD